MNLIWVLVRNMGTYASMLVKGEVQVEDPQEPETDVMRRGGSNCSSDEGW
jgi:hypothetical protein